MNFNYLINIIPNINKITQNYIFFGQTIIDLYLGQTPKTINILTIEPPYLFVNYLESLNIEYEKDIVLTFYYDNLNYKVCFAQNSYYNYLSKQITTMNSIALNNKLEIIDYFNGINDIDNKIIKLINNNIIYSDNKIMIKLIRYAAEYGYKLDECLFEIINEHSPNILLIDNHLIKDEIIKICMSDHPEYIKLLEEYGLLKYILPELHLCFHTPQENPEHIYNVGDFIIEVLKNTPKDYEIRLAVLLHDIGKCFSKRIEPDGIAHFYGHEFISKEKASTIFERLYFSQKDVRIILKLIELHNYNITSKIKSLRKFIISYNITDDFFDKFIKIKKAIILAKNPNIREKELHILNKIVENYEIIKNNKLTIKDLNITNKELIDNGINKRKVKIISEMLLEYITANPENNTKEKLLKYAKEKAKKIRI